VLFNSVSAFVKKHALLTSGQKLVVGVSGGPDSVALLHLLTRLQTDAGLHLTAAHLDHRLRPESAHDAEFVERIAKAWDLECVIERVDVKALAQNEKLSIEEAGRLARYNLFARLGSTVAVAHHADDQAETVLMHFLRGSGLSGLRGMRPSTQQITASGPLTVIRPLLEATRAEIEAYIAQHQLEFVVDASNADQTYFRNRLRHELVPLLQTYNANIREVLGRTAEVMTGDYELLQPLIEKAWHETLLAEDESIRFDLGLWRALPLGLRRALLRRAVTHLRPALRNLNFVPLENALHWVQSALSGHQADLLAGLSLHIIGKELRLSTWDQFPVEQPEPIPLLIPGDTLFLNHQFTASLIDNPSFTVIRAQPDSFTAYLNPALAPFTIRTRRPGDRFTPLGLSGSLKLSDFMVNRKLPVDQRDTWPLLCYGPDTQTIAWVCGHALSETAKVTDQESALKIVVQKL
jgi:tRNA(Ile)-lysidine synthase